LDGVGFSGGSNFHLIGKTLDLLLAGMVTLLFNLLPMPSLASLLVISVHLFSFLLADILQYLLWCCRFWSHPNFCW